MIWSFIHPIRGFVAGFAVLALAPMVFGFATGLPELALIVTVAIGACLVAGRPPGDHSSRRRGHVRVER